jgi:hypothetical protein
MNNLKVLGRIDIDRDVYKRHRPLRVEDVTKERSQFHITFTVPRPINEFDAYGLQMDLGYHPNGYGFYFPNDGKSHTTWRCSNSCD